jgi:outer membrane receptor protein involved in Fe transport
VLVFALATTGGLDPFCMADEPEYRGRRLVDVLRELRDHGLEVIFSSAVVGDDLRVSVEPSATEPRELLGEILRPLGLQARVGPAGSILILPIEHETGNLKGRVLSTAGGRPVAGASVRLGESGQEAVSAPDGSFEIRDAPAGIHDVTASAPGFAAATFSGVRIDAGADAELIVELKAQPTFITEVVVTPSRHALVRQEQASRHVVTGEEAVLAPTIGGDVSRVVELLPGVATGGSTAAFNVRGSLARDVSLILDGLELYDPFHLQSFQSPFSLVDANVVDRIEFFGGGFTAELGDRHGGFVEISTLVPGSPARGELELGTLNTRFSYRAPTSNGSGSWLVSARAWYPDAVVSTTELGRGEELDPRFEDLYTKVAFNLTPRHRLSAHGLLSYDRLRYTEVGEEVNEEVDALTRNRYVWARAFSAWSENLSSETVLSLGRIERFRDGISEVGGARLVDDDRAVDFVGIKHHSTWELSGAHVLKAGADLRSLRAEYRYSNEVPRNPDGTSWAVYAAHRARVSSELVTELGARWDRQTFTRDNQLSPRFNAAWRPDERTELRFAAGRFSQSQRIHELHVEDGETDFSVAEAAEQAELSFRRTLGNGVRLRLDAYYKKLTRLRPRYENLFEPIELFPETTSDRVVIEPDKARLRGAELLLRGDPGRPLFWWVHYALSAAEDVIDGETVPRSWDQTHAGRFLVGYRRDERWSVALTGSIRTGWPTTPILAEVVTLPDGSTEIEAVPGARNTDRFSTYSRFDVKARRSFDVSRGRLWLTLEIVNLTDRDNPCCLDDVSFDPRPDGTIDVHRQDDSWLGIAPSFSVLWEF